MNTSYEIYARYDILDLQRLYNTISMTNNKFVVDTVRKNFTNTTLFNFSTLEKIRAHKTIPDYTEILQFRKDFNDIVETLFPSTYTYLITLNDYDIARYLFACCYLCPYHVSNVNKRRLL